MAGDGSVRQLQLSLSQIWWYNRGMKIKTSVTLSEALLKAIDLEIHDDNRSAFIEEAAWNRLRELRRAQRDKVELANIDAHADKLNSEALDVLDFQDRS